MYAIATGTGHGPRPRISSFSVLPSTYSMTMKYEPSASPRSKMATMFGCERPAACVASRRKRSTNWSSFA